MAWQILIRSVQSRSSRINIARYGLNGRIIAQAFLDRPKMKKDCLKTVRR